MQPLIKLFWDICRLQKGPQDVPTAPILFWLLLGLGLIADFAITVSFVDFQSALLLVLANTTMLFAVVVFMLVVLGYAGRIMPTLTALVGTGLVFSVIRVPVIIMAKLAPQNSSMFGLVEIMLLLWSLAVVAHILRHALSIQLFLAGVLAFGYFMLSFQLVNVFVPQAV